MRFAGMSFIWMCYVSILQEERERKSSCNFVPLAVI